MMPAKGGARLNASSSSLVNLLLHSHHLLSESPQSRNQFQWSIISKTENHHTVKENMEIRHSEQTIVIYKPVNSSSCKLKHYCAFHNQLAGKLSRDLSPYHLHGISMHYDEFGAWELPIAGSTLQNIEGEAREKLNFISFTFKVKWINTTVPIWIIKLT